MEQSGLQSDGVVQKASFSVGTTTIKKACEDSLPILSDTQPGAMTSRSTSFLWHAPHGQCLWVLARGRIPFLGVLLLSFWGR